MKKLDKQQILEQAKKLTNIYLDTGEHLLTFNEFESQREDALEILAQKWEESKRARFVRNMIEAVIDTVIARKDLPPSASHVHAICNDLMTDAEAYRKNAEDVHCTHIEDPETKIVLASDLMKDARARAMEGNRRCPPDPCAEIKLELVQSKLYPQLEDMFRYLLLVLYQAELAKIEEMSSSASS